jgi:hypothetical protein
MARSGLPSSQQMTEADSSEPVMGCSASTSRSGQSVDGSLSGWGHEVSFMVYFWES